MGVSTTHRINLSMWILIYSFSDTYCVWAACAENMIFNHFFIFSWLKIGYKQNSETKVNGKSLFQFWFAIRKLFSPFSVVPAFVWLIDLFHAPLTSSNFYNIFIVGLVFILWNALHTINWVRIFAYWSPILSALANQILLYLWVLLGFPSLFGRWDLSL